jgi:hypothetical protein
MYLDNPRMHDDSLFPKSIGAHPLLAPYGLANKLSPGLAQRLTGLGAQFS